MKDSTGIYLRFGMLQIILDAVSKGTTLLLCTKATQKRLHCNVLSCAVDKGSPTLCWTRRTVIVLMISLPMPPLRNVTPYASLIKCRRVGLMKIPNLIMFQYTLLVR